jgi:hypothetical protein
VGRHSHSELRHHTCHRRYKTEWILICLNSCSFCPRRRTKHALGKSKKMQTTMRHMPAHKLQHLSNDSVATQTNRSDNHYITFLLRRNNRPTLVNITTVYRSTCAGSCVLLPPLQLLVLKQRGVHNSLAISFSTIPQASSKKWPSVIKICSSGYVCNNWTPNLWDIQNREYYILKQGVCHCTQLSPTFRSIGVVI